MAIVKLSKQRVMKAIATEPHLRPLMWIDTDSLQDKDSFTLADAKECPVCAVGAVMRNILDPEQDIAVLDDTACKVTRYGCVQPQEFNLAEFQTLVGKKQYMTALSYAFEGLCEEAAERVGATAPTELSRHQIYRVRKRVIGLVKEHFPRSIEIKIQGARLARDVVVV